MTRKITGRIKMPEYAADGLRLQSGSVTPAYGRIINVFPDENHDAFSQFTVEAVTSDIDSDILPENIRKDVNILGCTGNYAGNGQEKTVTPSSVRQTVRPDSGYHGLSKVTVNAVEASMIDGLIPENIKSGVPILNIVGTLEGGNNKYSSSYSYNVFAAAALIESAELPAGITSIGESLFSARLQLKSVILPDTVTEIKKRAFNCAHNLRSINLPEGLVSIGEQAFNGCRNLTWLYLPDTLTSISERAFAGCAVTELSIPPLVTALPKYMCLAQYNEYPSNNTLFTRTLRRVYIPVSVVSIGESAFSGQSNLTDIYYEGTEEQWNAITKGSSWRNGTSAVIHYNSSGLPTE